MGEHRDNIRLHRSEKETSLALSINHIPALIIPLVPTQTALCLALNDDDNCWHQTDQTSFVNNNNNI
jgi:hypothetical protein